MGKSERRMKKNFKDSRIVLKSVNWSVNNKLPKEPSVKRKDKKKKRQKESERKRKKKKKKEEEEKKKNALAAMSMNFGGAAQRQNNRKGKRAQDKDKKKKILADRRKQLNVDHLSGEKLQEKAIELHKWLSFLEEDKYDFEVKHDFLKQELKQHRQRVNDLMGAKAKGKINTR